MITFILIAAILLAITPLLAAEYGFDPVPSIKREAKVIFEAWGERGYFGKIIKDGLEKRARERQEAKVVAMKAMLRDAFIEGGLGSLYIYGDGEYDWYPMRVKLKSCEDLSKARRIMRNLFGTWTDKIQPGTCHEEDGVHYLEARYQTPEPIHGFWFAIETQYDLEKLPPGLLKEGCTVEREVITTMTCKVVCAS